MKEYFVSYSHRFGFGCCQLMIDGEFRIRDATMHIQQEYGVLDVTILFFKQLQPGEESWR